MKIPETLRYLRPNEEWALTGDKYSGLDWYSNTPKPTESELEKAWEEIKDNVAWKPTRDKRNQLLAESDWTQTLDAPVDKQAWSEYRQELRDITKNFSNFEDVIWPLKPGQ